MAGEPLDEEAIFHVARGIDSPRVRATYLDQACAGDQALRRRVESLIEAHEREESVFLKSNNDFLPTADYARKIDVADVGDAVGEQLGPYKLLQKIGEGGMGVVYMAEQTAPVRRRVALKIVKPGMDSRQVIARFEAERQALALMDHQNIARVFDAGTTSMGRPYFVMELVKGVPITEYCDSRRLTLQERLKLLLPVCRAVHHAHQKGIIHRDIKPSNVLIANYDGRPVPKVIDFGIAKAAGQQLTDRTVFTEIGQVLGTLEYMSPEQAELNQLDVDTRTDVYSLGVLLYELLTGSTPITKQQLRQVGLDQVLRTIREKEPPIPSTRLSDSGDELVSISAVRSIEPARLSRLVRGDLDWIAMKALDKERSRRYGSANELALDLERYLDGQVVEACPPSFTYRANKLIRRHRLAFGVALSFVVVLLIAAIVSLWQASVAINALDGQRLATDKARSARNEEARQRIAAQDAASDAIKSAREAKRATRRAMDSETNAKLSQLVAEKAMRRAQSHRLATEAQAEFQNEPQRSLLLAIEAMETTSRHGEPIIEQAIGILNEGLMAINGRPFVQLTAESKALFTSADGRWLIAGSPVTRGFANIDGQFFDGRVEIWDLDSPPNNSRRRFLPHAVLPAAFDASRRWLVTASTERGVAILWDFSDYDGTSAPRRRELKLPAEPANADESGPARPELIGSSRSSIGPALLAFAFSREASRLVTQYADNSIAVWEFADLAELPEEDSITPTVHRSADPASRVAMVTRFEALPETGAMLSGDGRWLIMQPAQLSGRSSYEPPRLVDLEANDGIRLHDLNDRFRVEYLTLDPKSRWLVVGYGIQLAESDPRRIGRNYDPKLDKPLVRVFDLKADNPDDSQILEDAVAPFVFTKDGSQLITGSRSGGILSFSTSGDRLAPPVALTNIGDARQISTSSNDRWLAAGFDTGNTFVWNLSTIAAEDAVRELRPAFSVESDGVFFSQDEHWMAIAKDGVIRLRDLLDVQTPEVELRGIDGGIAFLDINADRRRVVAHGPLSKTIRIWDLDPKQSRTYPTPVTSKTFDIPRRIGLFPIGRPAAFSPRGKWLAAFGDRSPIKVWAMNEFGINARPRTFGDPDDNVLSLGFSADEQHCFTTTLNGVITLWDLSGDADKEVSGREFTGPPVPLQRLSVSDDGRWLIGQNERSLSTCYTYVWDLNDHDRDEQPQRYSGRWGGVIRDDYLALIAFKADRTQRVRFAKLGEEDTAENRLDFVDDTHQFITLDKKWVVTRSDEEIHLWDVGGLEPPTESLALPAPPNSNPQNEVELSPDSRWLLTTSRREGNQDGYESQLELQLWDLFADGGPRLQKKWTAINMHGWERSFSPDGRWLIQSEREGIRFWDLSTGDLRETSCKLNIIFGNSKGVGQFSGDGRWFTLLTYETGQYRRRVYRWDLHADDLNNSFTVIPTTLGAGDSTSWDGKWSLLSKTNILTTEVVLFSLDPDVLKQLAREFVGRSLLPSEPISSSDESLPDSIPPISDSRSATYGPSNASNRRDRGPSNDSPSDDALPYMITFDADGDGALQSREWSLIRSDWSAADINGNGEITLAELSLGMELRSYSRKFTIVDENGDWLWREEEWMRTSRICKDTDADGDGAIQLDEFLAESSFQPSASLGFRDRDRDGALSPEEWSSLKEAAKFDDDQDGWLTREEYRSFRRDLLLRDQFAQLDSNGDQQIDRWEASVAGYDAALSDTNSDGVISFLETAYQNHAYFDDEIAAARQDSQTLQDASERASAAHRAAVLLRFSGRLAEAVAMFEKTLDLRTKNLGDDDIATSATMIELANCYLGMDRTDEAAALLVRAVKGRKQYFGANNHRTQELTEKAFHLSIVAGRGDDAVALANDLVDATRGPDGAGYRSLVHMSNVVAEELLKVGRFETAEVRLRECRTLLQENQAAKGATWATTLSRLGAALAGNAQSKRLSTREIDRRKAADLLAEAEVILVEAMDHLPEDDESVQAIRAATIERLAGVYDSLENPERAKYWRQMLPPSP